MGDDCTGAGYLDSFLFYRVTLAIWFSGAVIFHYVELLAKKLVTAIDRSLLSALSALIIVGLYRHYWWISRRVIGRY